MEACREAHAAFRARVMTGSRDLPTRGMLAHIEQTQKRIEQVRADPDFEWRCSAGDLSVVIDKVGNVYGCETLWKKFGSLRDEGLDLERVLPLDRARTCRKRYSAGCRCTHETNVNLDSALDPGALWSVARQVLVPSSFGEAGVRVRSVGS